MVSDDLNTFAYDANVAGCGCPGGFFFFFGGGTKIAELAKKWMHSNDSNVMMGTLEMI